MNGEGLFSGGDKLFNTMYSKMENHLAGGHIGLTEKGGAPGKAMPSKTEQGMGKCSTPEPKGLASEAGDRRR